VHSALIQNRSRRTNRTPTTVNRSCFSALGLWLGPMNI